MTVGADATSDDGSPETRCVVPGRVDPVAPVELPSNRNRGRRRFDDATCMGPQGDGERDESLDAWLPSAPIITTTDSVVFIIVIHVNQRVDSGTRTSSEANGDDDHEDDRCRRPVEGGDTNVVTNATVDGLLEGSNGTFYTEWQVSRELRAGRWKRCVQQREPDRRLVETDDGSLLLLTPVDELPDWAEIRVDDHGARVVETRRPLPK